MLSNPSSLRSGSRPLGLVFVASLSLASGLSSEAADPPPKIPRFSVEHLDKSVDPSADFFRFAAGNWIKNNPVPSDKSRWSGFDELQQRNWHLLCTILDDCADGRGPSTKPARQVGDFFSSAMNTNRLEKLAFKPIKRDLRRIDALKSPDDLFRLLADLHQSDVDGLFRVSVAPDAKNSSLYAFYVSQGGLGLPDRDYYISDAFAKQREAYREHIVKMLGLLGEK